MFEDDDDDILPLDILPLYQNLNPPIYEYIDKRVCYGKKWRIIDEIYYNKTKKYILDSNILKIIPTYNFNFRPPRHCHLGVACPIFYMNYVLDYKEDNKCYFKCERNYKKVKWFVNIDTLNITWYSTNFINPMVTYNYKLGIDFFYEMLDDSLWNSKNEIGLPSWYKNPYFYSELEIDENKAIEIKEDDDDTSKMIVKNINTIFI